MPQNNLPDRRQDDDQGKAHQDTVRIVQGVLSELHPDGSFDLKVITSGGVAVAVATDNLKYIAERKRVGEDFRSIDAVLRLGESSPIPGTTYTITLGNGQTGHFVFDSMENLLKMAKLGVDTATSAYALIDEERQMIVSFLERMEKLGRG